MSEPPIETNSEKSFEELSQDKQLGLATEFLMFIKENKIWWMLPIILVLGMVGILAFLTTTGAAPFIYTLF
ncbi:MAG: DUF5989 family protein [Planctomycetaceae bacterium]|jgi:hypothetical protein|nr:DUF5989 family protein [Planctomycetaceae bacterium]MDG2391797.1 DUF5989 family protein [Planctomycetaceae bacterium]